VSTPAVVLHAFKYGETSKIVRLATAELGLQSAIAKGASQPKSKFGARLQVLSEGVAQIYVKQNRDLQTLAEFEVTQQRSELARDVQRFAAAAALAELMLRCAPAEPAPELYASLVFQLDRLTATPSGFLAEVSLSALWQMVCALGFEPALGSCARDGRGLPEDAAVFSVSDGGFLCGVCAPAAGGATLNRAHRTALEQLVSGDVEALGRMTRGEAASHRRLLARFIRRHLAEDRELKALAFWESAP